ncbi:MAG: mycofactocin precursor MftA [Ilumatobacteraceae bacterium]
MDSTETAIATTDADPMTTVVASNDQVVVEELLIEEISIDGMCGVY